MFTQKMKKSMTTVKTFLFLAKWLTVTDELNVRYKNIVLSNLPIDKMPGCALRTKRPKALESFSVH